METFHTPEGNPQPGAAKQYSYKPLLIGAVIKTLMNERRMTPRELGKKVGVRPGNVYRLFRTRTMALPMLFKMSEALGENLLLRYHPNVKPLPHPLEAENAQLKAENEMLKQQLEQLKTAAEENKLLKAQLDILREVAKGR